MYFALNDAYSVEPRLGMDFSINDNIKLALGYGLHSQIEKLSFYLADIPGVNGTEQLNSNLDLAKSHHLVLGYDHMLGEHTHLRIEPYYQYLYDVPVIDQSYFSMLNL
ncbi:MAG: prevent-host-death protein, partial [Bacteroidota bacterium]